MESLATSSSIINLPKRPQRDPKAQGQEIKLFSNYYQLEFDSPTIVGVNKYTCKFEPELPDNSNKMRAAVLKPLREKLREHIDFFIFQGPCIYSLKKAADIPQLESEHEGTKFKISIEWVQLCEKGSRDHVGFLKLFFNSMMRGLRFETIGRKSFNSAKGINLAAHKIKVWPGFDARLITKESGVLLNIDVCFKVVRQDSMLEYMNELTSKIRQRNGDTQAELTEALVGTTVVTR